MQWLIMLGFIPVGWIAGLLVYHAGSVLLGISLPDEYSHRLARYHFIEATQALERFLIHVRERADVKLMPSKPNVDEAGGERITYHGEAEDFDDPENLMTYCFNKPCGIAIEGTQALVDPIVAEAGSIKRELRDANQFERDLSDITDLDEQPFGYSGLPIHVPVSRAHIGATLEHALEWTTAGAPPTAVDTSYTYGEKSQSEFNTSNQQQLLMLGILFAIGAGIVFLLSMLISGGGGGGGAPSPSDPGGGQNVTAFISLLVAGVRAR